MPAEDAPVLATVTGFPAAGGTMDLEVRRGEVVLLKGPNGAGKTSVLRALAGLRGGIVPAEATLPSAASEAMGGAAGEAGEREGAGREAREEKGGKGGGLPHHAASRLSARDLSRAVRVAWQSPRDTLVGLTVAGEFRIRGMAPPATPAAWGGRTVATLSSGEARSLVLAVARASDAPLLLLDEPAEGLDDAGKRALGRLVEEAAARGAVVAADHTGLLAAWATRTVLLGAPRGSPAGSADTGWIDATAVPTTAPRIVAPHQTLLRGKREVEVPAIALPAGFHVLVGPNGGGKSTLLLGVAGLIDASVAVDDGLPLPGVNVRLLLPNVRDLFTAARVADELPAADHAGPMATHLLDDLVGKHLLDRHPLTLSAGEAQRVALAKTFGRNAPVYLLDEPEANLDGEGRKILLAAIASRIRDGACVLAATHDAELVALAHSVTTVGDRAAVTTVREQAAATGAAGAPAGPVTQGAPATEEAAKAEAA